MNIAAVLDLFRTKWQMIPSKIFLLGTGVLCFLILFRRIFKSLHVRREVKGKDLTVEMLREQFKMMDEHHKVREVVAKVPHVEPRPRLKALAFLAAPPRLLETFVSLSDHVQIWFPKDPLEEPI